MIKIYRNNDASGRPLPKPEGEPTSLEELAKQEARLVAIFINELSNNLEGNPPLTNEQLTQIAVEWVRR